MKKHFFKYNRQTILFQLSLILLISIYIIVRDCELTLIYFNSNIDKYLEAFFLKSSNDNTLYNIAISYVAAYIFYLIQVHIPAVNNHNHGISLLKNDITKNINNIKILLLIVSEMTEREHNALSLNDNIDDLYIIEKSQNQIFRLTFLNTYCHLKKRIIDKNTYILTSPTLNYLDNNLCELLSTLPIEDLFILSDNIYSQKKKHTNTHILDNGAISRINLIISELEHRYDFSFETYSITHDINHHSEYMAQQISIAHYTQNELEIKVKLI